MINNKGPRRKLVRNTNKSLLSQKSMCSGRLLVHALLFAFPRLSHSLCRWLGPRVVFGWFFVPICCCCCFTWIVLLQRDRTLLNYTTSWDIVLFVRTTRPTSVPFIVKFNKHWTYQKLVIQIHINESDTLDSPKCLCLSCSICCFFFVSFHTIQIITAWYLVRVKVASRKTYTVYTMVHLLSSSHWITHSFIKIDVFLGCLYIFMEKHRQTSDESKHWVMP